MRTIRILLSAALFLVAGELGRRTLTGAMSDLPKPFVYAPDMPATTEFWDADQVTPGTFKFEISTDEMSRRAKENPRRALVTYSYFKSCSRERSAWIGYWLQRDEQTFYHAFEKIRMPAEWGFFTGIVMVRHDQAGNLIFYPGHDGRSIVVMLFTSAIMLTAGSLTFPWRRKGRA